MARADPGAVVAMEIFIEQDEIAPVRILLKLFRTAVDGTPTIGPAQKGMREPSGQPSRNVGEQPTRAHYRPVSAATSASVRFCPDPVGYSTVKLSPK